VSTTGSTTSAELVDAYAAGLPFPLDPFQREACEALLDGDGVLLCAPTGSGKTVIGEFGVWATHRAGRRAFYTTPLKALSNQKYTDLRKRFGDEHVGLLTGDNQLNGDAPIVVMTTEVLRNMLYERSPGLDGLSLVVLDEVHYLADRSRGATWEEVLIHLPSSVRIAALSATISNHGEFADWLRTLRGEIAAVVETHRPVPIEHRMLVDDLLYPLLDDDGRGLDPRLARRLNERMRREEPRSRDRRGRPRRSRDPRVDRPAVALRLRSEKLLPAIVFIFSRAGCTEAVRELLAAGVRLTSDVERRAIDAFADEQLAALDLADHDILEVEQFRAALRNGIAAHHAGMIPLLKETVEALFTRALVKVVYATETLALGINMPARTVVIERIVKFNGQTHEPLTPTEFTQLTGRAGRRGIDSLGVGVVCEPRELAPEVLASLAVQSASPLVSAFKPSYNMAINLLRRMSPDEADALLGRSFAQFLADRGVVSIEQRLVRARGFAAAYEEQIACDCGDVWRWWEQTRTWEHDIAQASQRRVMLRRREVRHALTTAAPGRVLAVDGRRVVVTERRMSKSGLASILGLVEGRELRRLSEATIEHAPIHIGDIALPKGSPLEPDVQEQVRALLEPLPAAPAPPPEDPEPERPSGRVEACPRQREHAHVCRQLEQARDEIRRLEQRVRRRAGALSRAFDAVCDILERFGYISDGDVTTKGSLLTTLYAASDLLIAEGIERGVLSDLDPPELAATLSSLVFTSRPGDGPPEPPPTHRVEKAVIGLARIADDIHALEEERRLELTGGIDPGLAAAVYAWAYGDALDDVLAPTTIAAGDFVRTVKQLDDLLRQLASLAGLDIEIAGTAREASQALRRGIVVAGGVT
jgi:ATP-dependent RNA helicase HelY